MTKPLDILEKFRKYADHDPNETHFDLLSNTYEYHRCCKQIAAMAHFDPNGIFSVLYAKQVFLRVMENSKIKVLKLLENPDIFSEEKEMFGLFSSDTYIEAENGVLNLISDVIRMGGRTEQIGDRNLDKERETLTESLCAVAEELSKCNFDLFLRGGRMLKITRFDTEVHTADTISKMLMTLEKAADGIMLWLITSGGTNDAHFNIILKSNGNILSINDRIDEAYPKQHSYSRNAHWIDDKKTGLFPYGAMVEGSAFDYLGYAQKLEMSPNCEFNILKMEPKFYMPLLLAMVMLAFRYENAELGDMPQLFIDRLLPINRNDAIAAKALIVPKDSSIAAYHDTLSISFTSEEIVNGTPAEKYSKSVQCKKQMKYNYREYGNFLTESNLFAQLYGDGFELDNEVLTEIKHYTVSNSERDGKAENKAANIFVPEFVGSEQRMGMIAYYYARKQLAEHIRKQMRDEYYSCGGLEAVKKWYYDAIRNNREQIIKMCAQCYKEREANVPYAERRNRYIVCEETASSGISPISSCDLFPINSPSYGSGKKYTKYFDCCVSATKARYYFAFQPENWEQLQEIVGEAKLPKIVKGWVEYRTDHIGNNLLDVCDAVAEIGTPFERREWNECKRLYDNPIAESDEYPINTPEYGFRFWVALSKRGLNEVLKLL